MNKHIVVTSDGMVNVEGEIYLVDLPVKAGVHALRWSPTEDPRGFIEQRGDSHGFSDYGLIAPYVEAWEKAKSAAKTEVEAKEAEVKAKEAEVKAEFEKRKAEAEKQAKEAEEKFIALQQDRAAIGKALGILADSDHEVIKAMEAKLAAEGALPDALVRQRQEARAVAKSEKQRLKAQEENASEE